LNASGIRGLRGDELIGRLTKVFQEYKGKDSVRLVWGYQGLPDSFAGVSLEGNCISVVESRPIEEREKHLWKLSRDQRKRQLNAAHILMAFWKLNGPGFLERMKERRNTARILIVFWKLEERRNAARILATFCERNGPRFLEKMKERRNTARVLIVFWKLEERRNAARILATFCELNGPRLLERMKERRNTARILNVFWELEERRSAAHILTTAWKLNGPRFLEKVKDRRRRSAPRYTYPKNCCLMVDMGGDRNWMY